MGVEGAGELYPGGEMAHRRLLVALAATAAAAESGFASPTRSVPSPTAAASAQVSKIHSAAAVPSSGRLVAARWRRI